MNPELSRKFIDAMIVARKIPGMMPELPENLTARDIHVLDIIGNAFRNHSSDDGIRVGDIARELNSTMPSVTRLVGGLASEGYVEKIKSEKDRRVSTVRLTRKGRDVCRVYADDYHVKLSVLLSKLSDSDVRTTIEVVSEAYQLMRDNPITPDTGAHVGARDTPHKKKSKKKKKKKEGASR